MEYRVSLTAEAWESCRRKPTAVLVNSILSMKPGDRLVVEGEELLYPSEKVRSILESEGLRISEYESDGIVYRIVAVKAQ